MPTTDTPIQPINIDLQSDAQGRFIFEIDKDLAPGQHIITVEDERGNSDSAILYVNEEPQVPQIVHAVTNIVPDYFFWGIAALFAIIIVLIVDVIRLAKKADDPEDQTIEAEHRYHFTINAILLCSLLLVITFIFGLYLNRETNFLQNFTQPGTYEAGKTVQMSGKLTDPITFQGIKGVDLVSLNTTIRTTESGQYSFGSVDTNKGLRLTYPNLIRAFVILPPGTRGSQQMDIFFNTEAYNLLVQVADLEMRGIFSDVYDYLTPEIKEKIDVQRYIAETQTIFLPSNIADQEIYITGTKIVDSYSAEKYGIKFNKVLQISVKANNKIDNYFFTLTTDGWRLIR